MSHYSWLICTDCKLSIWLGKIVFDNASQSYYFHMGDASDPRNSEQLDLNRVIWKFLANHMNHSLQAINDQGAEYKFIDDYVEIGGDEIKDINFDTYLKDWPG